MLFPRASKSPQSHITRAKMLFKTSVAVLLLQAVASIATPTWDAYEFYLEHLPKHPSKHQGTRPPISFSPKQPYKPFPPSPPRNRDCYVKSHDDLVTDDSTYILEAIDECNNGGHVIFSQGTNYVIGTALNLTFLNHIDIGKRTIRAAKDGWR